MRLHDLFVVCLLVAVGLRADLGTAEEPHQAFLKALRESGYGELAVDYVQKLQQAPNVPVALKEVLDLELAHSLMAAANETEHRDVAEQRMTSAKAMLDKFLKEHAEHPAATEAFSAMADMESQRGQSLLRQARVQKDEAARKQLLADARAAFEAARPRYATAVERFARRFQKLEFDAQNNKRRTKRDEEQLLNAELDWLGVRGQEALIDYYIAQTYSDPKDPDRKAALQKAGSALDDIYQRERLKDQGLTTVGLYAHMWHGKIMDELGDVITALDIYEEVLANAPAPNDRRASSPPLMSLFAQVEYFRLLLLMQQKAYDRFIYEAQEWLEYNKRSEKTNGYQGISLELAKALGAKAESATADEARKLKREALIILARMVDVPSEFQQDAIVLRRLMGEQGAEIANFTEAMAIATAAIESNQLNEAVGYYEQGLALAAKDPKMDPDEIVRTRFRLSQLLWAVGKIEEAGKLAEAIITETADSKAAPEAASLAINAAKAKYFAETTPEGKASSLERLAKLSDYTIAKWPDRAEADDARIALGQASMVRGEFAEALKAFETVRPESDRFAQALQQAGQVNWQLYLLENRKPPASRDANQLAAYRDKAEQQLQQSRELQRKALKMGEPIPSTLSDAELLLGEILLEANKPDQAVQLLEPLVEASKASGGSLDRTKLRLFVAAVRAFVATKAFDKASGVATVLMQSGDDSPVINHVLVDFAKLIGLELKRAESQALATEQAGNAPAAEQAAALAKDLQSLYTSVLEQMATRRNHSLANLVFLGETCAERGLTDKARELFETILAKAAEEKGSVPAQAEIRIRAKLIGLLRNEKKFNEALPEVEKLITATGGRALEPLVEKGNLLQARAETVPYDPKLFDEAIAHWTSLRLRMQSMNPKPTEYYELVYNTAHCVLVQAENSNDKSKALTAIQILNSVLQLSRASLAPDVATRYDALIAKARRLQQQLEQ